MRCRDAKFWLTAQRDEDLAQPDTDTLALLQAHLEQCTGCHAHEQSQHHLDALLRKRKRSLTLAAYPSISTERIMLAVQQQSQLIQQVEALRKQQRSRLAPLGVWGPLLLALTFFTLGSIPLLLFAMVILQPNLMEKAFAALSSGMDVSIVLGQRLQIGLMLITQDTWLLSGVAFVVVVMVGVWLRLMRHPHEA